MQPSASQDQVNLPHNIGRRRRCDTDDEENRSPIVGSDAKQGKDEDVVRPPRGKRRRVNTSALATRRKVRDGGIDRVATGDSCGNVLLHSFFIYMFLLPTFR